MLDELCQVFWKTLLGWRKPLEGKLSICKFRCGAAEAQPLGKFDDFKTLKFLSVLKLLS